MQSTTPTHKPSWWLLPIALFLFSLVVAHTADAQNAQKTWTDTPDWASASSHQNITWNDVQGQIQLVKNPTKSQQTPFIYIPNSASNTITQLDTKTGKRNWTISLDPVFKDSNASRTTVDANGHVWVGLRNTDKVVWISSAGKIKKVVKTGQRPRAITVDLDGNVWVGNWNVNTLFKLDGKTGNKIFSMPMDCPYGLVADIHNNVWAVNRCKGKLTKISTKGKVLGKFDAEQGYGIATDINGQVWVAHYTKGCLHRYTNAGKHLGCIPLGSNCKNARGVAVDGDSNVWVACSNTPLVVKVSPSGKILATNTKVGKHCVGMAVDADGFIWAVARGDATASKIRASDAKLVGKYSTHGSGPYTYSDMTGFQFQNLSQAAQGVWRGIHSTPCLSKWTKITWNGATPPGTSITFRARTAPTKAGLANAAWSPALTNGSAIPTPNNPWLEVEVSMKTFDAQITPYVTDITVESVPMGDEICNGKDDNCDGFIDNVPGTNRPLTKTCKTQCDTGIAPCIAGDWSLCSARHPAPEVCNGIDDDCNGKIDDGSASCSGSSICHDGACSQPCTDECPAGQKCTQIGNQKYCVGSTPCADIAKQCEAEGKVCRNGRCVDACYGINCPNGYLCEKGQCIQDNCYHPQKPCPSGQICRNGACVANPCDNVNCTAQQYCKEGKCLPLCDNASCPDKQSCKDGTCQNDPCYGIRCASGQVCLHGKCTKDPCAEVACGTGKTCTSGQCVDDPCAAVRCPDGQVCVRPQGDCFGKGPGQDPVGPPLPPSEQPIRDAGTPDTQNTETAAIDYNLSDFSTYVPDNGSSDTTVTRRFVKDCVCSANSPKEAFQLLALFSLLFLLLHIRRRHPTDD